MQNHIEIYVPSLGRAGTAQLLNFAEVQKDRSFYRLTVFVEPQEEAAYRRTYPSLQIEALPQRGQGITYVRNYMKICAEMCELDYCWFLDDDITALSRAPHKKETRGGFDILAEAQAELIAAGVALGALEYSQFAWCAVKPLNWNSYCDICVFMDIGQMSEFRYRPETEGKEDRDLVMQVLEAGLASARTTAWAFMAPTNGSNAGGLKETFYDIADKESQLVDRMLKLWPATYCEKVVKPSGRIDLKIHWKRIGKPTPAGEQSSLF